MTLLCGETLLFESHRLFIEGRVPATYYQYRDCNSLIEAAALHDRILVFRGHEGDEEYLARYAPLVDALAEMSIDVVHLGPSDIDALVTSTLRRNYEHAVRDIYGAALGVTIEELVTKAQKQRYGADFSDWVGTRLRVRAKTSEWKSLGDDIRRYAQQNSSEPELHYFLRAHLMNQIAAAQGWTTAHSGTRLIADILENALSARGVSPSGPGAQVYQAMNDVWLQRVSAVASSDEYPIPGFLPVVAFEQATGLSDVLPVVRQMRDSLASYRQHYRTLSATLYDGTSSVADRESAGTTLQETASLILLPLARASEPRPKRLWHRLIRGLWKAPLKDLESQATASTGDEGASAGLSFDPVRLVVASAAKAGKEIKDTPTLNRHSPLLDMLSDSTKLGMPPQACRDHLPLRNYPSELFLLLEEIARLNDAP